MFVVSDLNCSFSELVDDRTVPRQVGAELLRQSASSYALPSASKQTDSASNDDGENEMLSLNWVLSFIKTKVESGFEVNDGPGGLHVHQLFD